MSRRAPRLRPRERLGFARALLTTLLLGGAAESAEPTSLREATIEQRGAARLRAMLAAASEDPPPKESGAAPPSAPKRVAPAGLARPVVYGIILGGSGWVAYIEDPGSGLVGAYRVGDEVAGATIEAIEEELVVLKTPDGPIQLRLSDQKPGSLPRPR